MARQLLVLTPEKTLVTYQLAGIPSRLLAHIFDLTIIVALAAAAYMSLGSLLAAIDSGLADGVLAVLIAALPFLYFILFEGLWNGQTLGKKAMSIRVRMADGTPLVFTSALGRNFVRVADLLPGSYLVGVIAMFTNERSQRLGDMVARTVVIYERVPQRNFSPAPYSLGVHVMEQYVGDLRHMTVEEYTALKRLCDRAPQLPAAVQEKLLREVWQPIASRHHIEPVSQVHPIYLAEATVMKFGRTHGLM
ncbi:MAG TPA: RDD family protein [Fimbriimonadaceae bacterium]|nr:RDD family protein [Fimbriimonadaceae bacterium]